MNSALRNLRFLMRRHNLCGFDIDYLSKLSAADLAWLETFARKYYEGTNETNPEYKKESGHRRWMAKHADAMLLSTELTTPFADRGVDDLTPETLLILSELPTDPGTPTALSNGVSDEAV